MSPNSGSRNGQAPAHTSKRLIGDTEDVWDKNSTTKSYHRMTVRQAQEYVEDLRLNNRIKELEKLEDDERRILETCARLSKNASTRKLQEDLKRSFRRWCKEVADKDKGKDKGKKIGLSGADRESFVKPNILAGSGKPPVRVRDDDDPARDMNAYFIFFEKDGKAWKGKTHRGPGFPTYEQFPNQRISIHEALNDHTHNPFKPTHDENDNPQLRYIHIPANHTGWIEKAMARYHDEHEEIPEKRVKTNKTLSRQFWKGQLHGSGLGRHPIHATHMRSRCSIIPGETQSLFVEQKESSITSKSEDGVQGKQSPSKDLAIFMPYLHWEMSGRRARMSKAVKEMLEEAKNENSKYRAKTSAAIKQDVERFKNLYQVKDHEHHEMARKMMKKTINPTKLGRYLLNLARLWDAMDMELDERMVKYGLISQNTNGNAPEPLLHLRRTLDQSYFLNLKDTSERDLDQVVYRATRGHGNHTRVVMVDQLWLWVLDEHTVITSFPKRWGRNKPDSSGIHKSLRERLAQADCKIMSAWHLASIIIDQCSNVFFDRTKPLDLRPEVMDIFAETLGDVNHYTTIAFKVFWHSVDVFTRNRDKRSSHRQSQKYLDINPEGTLLKEAQDIVEELKIMIGIFSQQLKVVKNFQKCLEAMNGDPKTRSRAPHLSKALLHHMAAWAMDHDPSSEGNREKRVSMAEMEFLEDLVEEVDNRKSEIVDLESAALQTCHQLQDLLSLKQQQASIVEAKAALDRADQSVEQGKAIMAFTIITIIFTPLGFFTSFFGMNNSLTGADWMTLGRQCIYMFCISAAIIICALSLVFKGSQLREFLAPLRDPKARWNALKTGWRGWKKRWYGKEPNEGSIQHNGTNDTRLVENTEEGRLDETNGAMHYFRQLGPLKGSKLSKLASRNNQLRYDVESTISPQNREMVRSKATCE